MHNDSPRVVVGAEYEFPGLSQIECNFKEAFGDDFQIYGNLAETVAAAVKKAKPQ